LPMTAQSPSSPAVKERKANPKERRKVNRRVRVEKTAKMPTHSSGALKRVQ